MDFQVSHTPLKLSGKPTLSQLVSANHICYSLANSNLCLVDFESFKNIHELQKVHQGRIGALRCKDNLAITGGYDNLVKIFDMRSWQLVHTFQKIPSRFTSIDKSQHILAGSTNSNIVFWDLRKMKQRSQFRQSFNGQVSYIRFQQQISTNLYGCSLDGMVNMFELTQPNEEDAFNWCYKILESPDFLDVAKNNQVLVKTVDHCIYKLKDGDLFGKISPNSAQKPRHVLKLNFKKSTNYQVYEYFTWSPEEKYVQHWVGQFLDKTNSQKCLGYLSNVPDIQTLDVVESGNGNCIAIYSDQNGNIHTNRFGQQKKRKNSHGQQLMSQNTQSVAKKQWSFAKSHSQNDLEVKMTNKNGYLIQKPASSLSKQKKFKPF